MATLDYKRRLGRVEARIGTTVRLGSSFGFLPFVLKASLRCIRKGHVDRKDCAFFCPIFRRICSNRNRPLALAAVILFACTFMIHAQSKPGKAIREPQHKCRLGMAAQGIHSLHWQGESEEQNQWLLQAQFESALNWSKGRWTISVPIELEGQAAWIPDSVYSITNDRLQLGTNLGWNLIGHDTLPNAVRLETKIRLETRWMHKSWIEKLRSFSQGSSNNLTPPTEPYLLNPGIVFLSFGLTFKLWKNLNIHAGLAGAKMNFVLSRLPGSDSLNHPVWGIEPQGPNPNLFWGWNTELAWHHLGKWGESYTLKMAVFSLPEDLKLWSGRAKAEFDFPLSRAFSLGYRLMWSYEPAQVSEHQWQHTLFIRFGWPLRSN